LAWLSAGILAAGVSAATIAGAAMAAADDDPGANATTSSQSTASAENETKSDVRKPGASPHPVDRATGASVAEEEPDEPSDGKAKEPEDEADELADNELADDSLTDDEAEEPADEEAEELEEVETVVGETESGSEHDGAIGVDEPEATPETSDLSAAADQANDTALAVTDKIQVTDAGLAHTPDLAAEREPVVEASTAETATTFDAQPSPARLVMTAVQEAAPVARPSLLNVVGSFFWGLFDLAVKLVDFPPAVRPGSAVTAGRGTLQIDCGDGYTTDADWYYPTAGEPEKFIYFQHGFPARAGFYNLTLAELAERNNAIVFAPNITANIFACDACALSGEPMQAAVARLFEGDRAALLASATAAGFKGTLPEQFVLTGQSAGAPMAVAAARYYYQFAPTNEKPNMVGVLLYDVSNTGGAKKGSALSNALDKLPVTIPVLNITAEPAPVNLFGDANPALAEKRPGQFNGIQLVGGAHSDAFRSSTLFGIPQVLVSLLFGASTPENVEAVHVLTQGWLTDMYERRVYNTETRTGIYGTPGDPGEVIVDIPTDAGLARGYVLPAPIRVLSPIDQFIATLLGLINVNYYATCAVNPDESASAPSDLACSA
jgi:hypothetical protein